jgi:hypothetical protein
MLWNASISFVMSVRPHETPRLPMDRFSWNLIWELFENVEIMQVWLNLTTIKCTLHEHLCTYTIIRRWTLLVMRNTSDKSCRENQNTHFMFNNFFRKCDVYEIMWKKNTFHSSVSTAITSTRTRHIATLYVKCLSCLHDNFFGKRMQRSLVTCSLYTVEYFSSRHPLCIKYVWCDFISTEIFNYATLKFLPNWRWLILRKPFSYCPSSTSDLTNSTETHVHR